MRYATFGLAAISVGYGLYKLNSAAAFIAVGAIVLIVMGVNAFDPKDEN